MYWNKRTWIPFTRGPSEHRAAIVLSVDEMTGYEIFVALKHAGVFSVHLQLWNITLYKAPLSLHIKFSIHWSYRIQCEPRNFD